MKKVLSIYILLTMAFSTLAKELWVSDEIKAPLRSKPELNATLIEFLPAGQKVKVIKKQGDYVKVKTQSGSQGWLSNYYILETPSLHYQHEPIKKELEKTKSELVALKASLKKEKNLNSELSKALSSSKDSFSQAKQRVSDYENLNQNLEKQEALIARLTEALKKEKEKSGKAVTRYVSLKKVSENAVGIDQQNQALQKNIVELEGQLQKVESENSLLSDKLNQKNFIYGAFTVLISILVGYFLSTLLLFRRRGRKGTYGGGL